MLSDEQEICSRQNRLPRPVEISLPSDDETLEALEGMLVSIKKPVVVDNYAAGTYGEITVAAERLWQHTQVHGCFVQDAACGEKNGRAYRSGLRLVGCWRVVLSAM